MFKFARKNKKLIGVVFGVILMIMFLSQLAPQGTTTQSNALQKTVATIDGQKVSLRDINTAAAEWQNLKAHYYVDSNDPNSQPQPLLNVLLGQEFAEQIEQAQKGTSPTPLFFLLAREADREGIIVPDEEVETLVNSHVVPAGDPNT